MTTVAGNSPIVPTSTSRSDIGPPPLPCWFNGSSAGGHIGYTCGPVAAVASRRVIKANGGRYLDTIGPKRRYHVPTSG